MPEEAYRNSRFSREIIKSSGAGLFFCAR